MGTPNFRDPNAHIFEDVEPQHMIRLRIGSEEVNQNGGNVLHCDRRLLSSSSSFFKDLLCCMQADVSSDDAKGKPQEVVLPEDAILPWVEVLTIIHPMDHALRGTQLDWTWEQLMGAAHLADKYGMTKVRSVINRVLSIQSVPCTITIESEEGRELTLNTIRLLDRLGCKPGVDLCLKKAAQSVPQDSATASKDNQAFLHGLPPHLVMDFAAVLMDRVRVLMRNPRKGARVTPTKSPSLKKERLGDSA